MKTLAVGSVLALTVLFASPAAAVVIISGTAHSETRFLSGTMTAPEISLTGTGVNRGSKGPPFGLGEYLPGETLAIHAVSSGSDLTGSAALPDGRTFTFGCEAPEAGPCNAFVSFVFDATGVVPAFNFVTGSVQVTGPFTFTGEFTGNTLPPSGGFVSFPDIHGSGLATTTLGLDDSFLGLRWSALSTEYVFVAPVPEPATLVLLGTGLVAAGVWETRRRRRVAYKAPMCPQLCREARGCDCAVPCPMLMGRTL